jgi:hypothetical protein
MSVGEGRMSSSNLVILSVILNFILIFTVIALLRELAKYKDAMNKIGGIASGLKKEPPAPPDPRKKMVWNIKR